MTFGLNHSELNKPWPVTDIVRCWDIQCDMARVHKGPGQYDWSRLDQWFDKAQSIGAKTIYVIHGTPTWNAKHPSNAHNAGWMPPGANSVPKDLDQLNEFVWNLCTRYKGRLDAIEVGNEAANLLDFWNPINENTMRLLAKIHKRSYKTAKSIDPGIEVIANSILPRKSSGGVKKASKFIKAMSEAGWPCDSVACHIYPNNGEGPDKFISMFKEVKKAVKDAGGPKRIVVTEASFNLLGRVFSPAETFAAVEAVKRQLKADVIWYAWDRKDLKGSYFGPDEPVMDLF